MNKELQVEISRLQEHVLTLEKKNKKLGYKNYKLKKELKNWPRFEELASKVEYWAWEKGINKKNNKFPFAQIKKVQEEVAEASNELTETARLRKLLDAHETGEYKDISALNKEFVEVKKKLQMEIGDIFVTLIILCQQESIDYIEALERAYDKISKRKGKTIDGQFVKEEE